nr:MAG: hypothetical protein DIU70_12665 [Bacillota bacterium]
MPHRNLPASPGARKTGPASAGPPGPGPWSSPPGPPGPGAPPGPSGPCRRSSGPRPGCGRGRR